jgi:hypothetical protein
VSSRIAILGSLRSEMTGMIGSLYPLTGNASRFGGKVHVISSFVYRLNF